MNSRPIWITALGAGFLAFAAAKYITSPLPELPTLDKVDAAAPETIMESTPYGVENDTCYAQLKKIHHDRPDLLDDIDEMDAETLSHTYNKWCQEFSGDTEYDRMMKHYLREHPIMDGRSHQLEDDHWW